MKTITYDETRFVLVPRVTTIPMLEAFEALYDAACRDADIVWAAMLAAAPSKGESE